MRLFFIAALLLSLHACEIRKQPDDVLKLKNHADEDTQEQTSGDSFKGCPPEGSPGSDTRMNLLKNRNTAPESYQPWEIADLLTLNPEALIDADDTPRSKWKESALQTASDYESQGISIEGYLLYARQSGVESCNCKREDLRDWHVWIGVDQPTSLQEGKRMRKNSIVVEPTPRWQERMGWRLRHLKKLAKQSVKIRISGWLLWDQEHPEELPENKGENATRGTRWEIHPVTKIEIYSSGSWMELKDMDFEE